jgi:peptide/nickel transport system substrate-binding protein
VFAEQAKKAGVEIRQNRIDPSSFFSPGQGFATRPFATSIYTTGTNSLATFYLASLVPGAPYNETGWGSPEDDNMLYAALAQTDETKAATLWHDVQQRQFDGGGYLIPANINYLDGYGLGVRGIKTTSAMNCNNFDFASAWLDRSST